MLRIVAFLTAIAASAAIVSAQCPSCGGRQPMRRPSAHPAYRSAGTFHGGGYGYPGSFAGYAYSYDPYATGRFRAPDLHDEPIFQQQLRAYRPHHSHPSSRPPLRFKHEAMGR